MQCQYITEYSESFQSVFIMFNDNVIKTISQMCYVDCLKIKNMAILYIFIIYGRSYVNVLGEFQIFLLKKAHAS